MVKIGKLIKYISFRSPMKGKNLDEEVQTDSPKRSQWRFVPLGAIITAVLSLGAYALYQKYPGKASSGEEMTIQKPAPYCIDTASPQNWEQRTMHFSCLMAMADSKKGKNYVLPRQTRCEIYAQAYALMRNAGEGGMNIHRIVEVSEAYNRIGNECSRSHGKLR